MMELAKVQKYWGIQSSSTAITGRLFTDDLFTFKHQALEYVRKVHESSDLERPEDYVTPVLLNGRQPRRHRGIRERSAQMVGRTQAG